MYSSNTDEEEYKARKSFTEMFVKNILKQGNSHPELIFWVTVIFLIIACIFIYQTK